MIPFDIDKAKANREKIKSFDKPQWESFIVGLVQKIKCQLGEEGLLADEIIQFVELLKLDVKMYLDNKELIDKEFLEKYGENSI